MNDVLNICAGLHRDYSIGHIARAAQRHQYSREWLLKVAGKQGLPDYVRYLAVQLVDLMDRPPVQKQVSTAKPKKAAVPASP